MILASSIVAYGEVKGYSGIAIPEPTPGAPPVIIPKPVNTADIIFEAEKFYKGDGGCNFVVEGFKGSSLCGTGIPNIGDKIVIFSCGPGTPLDKATGYPTIAIHSIGVHTGALVYGVDKAKLREIQ